MARYRWRKDEGSGGGIGPQALLGIAGFDPASPWLLDFAVEDFFRRVAPDNRGPIPFLISLRNECAWTAFNGVLAQDDRTNRKRIYVFPIGPTVTPHSRQPFVAYAWKEFFEAVRDAEQTNGGDEETERLLAFKNADKIIKLAAPLGPDSWGDAMCPFPEKKDGAPPCTDHIGCKPVIMALIDDGIGIANHRFRREDSTSRVEYFWHMGMRPESSPRAVPYGREFAKTEIDQALCKAGWDDAEFYRATGILDLMRERHDALARRHSHGTHVLDLMAGADQVDDVANRPIIAVQLPPEVVEDSSGAQLEAHLGAALDYIRGRAKALAPSSDEPIPVVVNVSYGFVAGSHDGQSLIEWLMDAISEADDPPMRLVLSAGNAHLARGHATIPPFECWKSRSQTLAWRVQPDDRTQSEVQIWLPKFDGDIPEGALKLEIEAPGGERSCNITATEGVAHLLERRTPAGAWAPAARAAYAVDPASGRGMISLRTMPTARGLHENEPAGEDVDRNALVLHDKIAPSGLWRLRLTAEAKMTKAPPIQVWVQRGDSIAGYPQAGRQSFLDDPRHPVEDLGPDYALTLVPPESPVRRASLLNAIAGGRRTAVIGAFELAGHALMPFSAGGPETERTPPDQRAPDAIAAAGDSFVHAGRLAAGSRSGAQVSMGGTSAAAPIAARVLADQFHVPSTVCWGRCSLIAEALRHECHLNGDARRPPPTLDANRAGAGRLPAPPVEPRRREASPRPGP